MIPNVPTHALIPMKTIGPVKMIGGLECEVCVPLATYETPLWPSTERGARLSVLSGGIRVTLVDERMTRSVVFKGLNAAQCQLILVALKERFSELQTCVAGTSRFAQLLDLHSQIVGDLLFLRFEFSTGDAAGHNMVTNASEALMMWIKQRYPELSYASLSANYCTDKKVSAVNGILGRGKYVVAELTLSRKLCRRFLKTTPEDIVELNTHKNFVGSILAGSLRSANAHFGNILLAFYLALGQDGVNVIEGSQGIVFTRVIEDDLYFSVTLPNIIVGSVGNGKDLPFVRDNLALLDCLEQREPGENARRLALIAAATVLCGELSLMAALTNEGELMESHLKFERYSKGSTHG